MTNVTDIKGIDERVCLFLEKVKEITVRNVYFVACGGSSALMYPSKYLMDQEANVINSDLYSSNEFIHRSPKMLGEHSVVILCSMSGNTPETVQAAQFARDKGALTVALTNDLNSPLANTSEYVVKYDWFPNLVAKNSNHSLMYQLVTGVLNVEEGNPIINKMIDSLDNLESVYQKNESLFADKVEKFAVKYKNERIIYTLASGSNFGVAYSLTSCFLMEMQWIHSNAIHAGEYFHGPFEILDEDTLFFHILGLDKTRPLEERALTFNKKYGKKLEVLDAKEFDLKGIDDALKGYIAPLVCDRIVRRYAETLAKHRNHPLSTRRYMWKVEY